MPSSQAPAGPSQAAPGGSVPPPPGPGDPAQSGPIPVIPPPPGQGGRLPLPRLPVSRRFPWWVLLAAALLLIVLLLSGLVMMNEHAPGLEPEPSHVGGAGSPGAGNGHSPVATMNGRSQAPDELGPRTVRVGEAGTDSGMRFTVDALSCGKKQVGTPPQTLNAKGTFCEADVRVTNVADDPQALAFADQKLYDTAGKSYASVTYSPGTFPGRFPYGRLKHGQTASGPIVFDVPAKVKTDYLVLHGNGSGTGLTVIM